MKRTQTSAPTEQEASGPLVAVCAGHRCSALHRLATGQDGAGRLRSTIKTGTGGVLVSTECLGVCARGAVAAVARRDGSTGVTGPSVWLSEMDQPAALAALLGWLASGGPARIDEPAESVPPVLHSSILGIGAPISAHSPQH
jgi:(2Fe-2S) ferredoxin